MMAATDLVGQHFTFLELDAVVPETESVRLLPVLVEEVAYRRLVVGVAQPQRSSLDLVIVCKLEAESTGTGHGDRARRLLLIVGTFIRKVEVPGLGLRVTPPGLVGAAGKKPESPVVADQPVVADTGARAGVQWHILRLDA